MTLETILNSLPEYAKDTKLNLSSIINNHDLFTQDQFYGLLLASAIASRNVTLTQAIETEAIDYLDEKSIHGVKAAVSIMSMTNIYYRFTDLVDHEEYAKMPAGLRMNIMRDPGVSKIDFELWSLAVSIINGCSMCVNAHEKQLIQHGISRDIIQFVAKIAAIVHALALTLEAF